MLVTMSATGTPSVRTQTVATRAIVLDGYAGDGKNCTRKLHYAIIVSMCLDCYTQ